MDPLASSAVAEVPELLPARMINEFVYCPRLFYLEWVQGEWRHNADTLDGRFRHKKVDTESGKLPAPDGVAEGEEVHARSVMLSSARHGIIARIDLVEADGPVATPVDYKRGASKDTGVWPPDAVQICAQALILREHGWQVDQGIAYYIASKRRIPVAISDELVAATIEAIAAARAAAASGVIPPPLDDSPKCPRCSLVGICLPDETRHLAAVEAPSTAMPETTTGASTSGGVAHPGQDVRRLFPARDDAQPVYVIEQGASVGKSGERLVIRSKSGATSVRLLDTSQLLLFGNISVSSPALRELVARGIPIAYFSYGGWFNAITTGMTHKNVELRQRQYRVADDAARSLAIARRVVAAKILNQRTLLRRNHPAPPDEVLRDLRRFARDAHSAIDAGSLLGLEGSAARLYFAHFGGMIKSPPGAAFDFAGRNRRPPRDPVNALLSFAYAILAKDLTATALTVGFDPFLGFLHRPRYGRPALALDLAEEFRPLIADSVVLSVLNTGEVKASDFVTRGDATALTAAGRKSFLTAYERRMDALVRHPILGYSASYRRTLEIQLRLLARHLLGEIPHYPPFRTR